MKSGLFAVAAVLLLAAGSAAAERGTGPCRADTEKFCKDVKPGGGRLIACLKEHEAELSADCKAKGLEAGEKAGKRAGACKADLEKFCKDVKGGHGEKLLCLKEHEGELSEICKADFAKRKEEQLKKNPCLADLEKFCKDVKPGEGRLIACLKAHEAELSAACKVKQEEKKEEREARRKEKREKRGAAAEAKSAQPEPASKPTGN